MEYILLAILFLVIFLIVFFKKNQKINNPALTKEKIIKSYEDELKEILINCKADKKLLLEKKIEFLKRVNHELSMNLFFDEVEAKEILKKFSSMEC